MSVPLGLWDWALRAYDHPAVRERCLALQDEHGQSVCLLLWAGWLAGCGVAPSSESLSAAARIAHAWEHDVLAPLRAARRALKTVPGLGDADRAALRSRVQADELAVEHALLDILEVLPTDAASARRDTAAALAEACAAWAGSPPPRETLDTLAAAFPTP